jgi:predicted transglutaminase-like cysteine proteinase
LNHRHLHPSKGSRGLSSLLQRSPVSLLLASLICLMAVAQVRTKEDFHLSRNVLRKAEDRYGKDAVARLMRWETLILDHVAATEIEKLDKVNAFFNETVRFVDDIDLYGVKDYWATPLEVLVRQAGDCEDFAIAKFFSLKAMGVAEDRLNIAYVKSLPYNMMHMVLTYYPHPGAEPLVLDNLVDEIHPASRRTDLMPIFSFNGSGLWMAKERGKGKYSGSSSRLKAWGDLLQRMAENAL